jgi:hypothetical protein
MWNEWEPCPTCLDIIKDVFSDYVDDTTVEVVPYDDDLEYISVDMYD